MVGLVLLGGLAYRAVVVYRWRPGGCGAAQRWSPAEGVRGAVPRPGHAGGPLRVVSYNVEGHAALWRRDHVARAAATIDRLAADVVGLQEVHRGTWQARFGDQARQLLAAGWSASFGASFRAGGGGYGNMVATRGDVLSAAVVPLPGRGEPRSVLVARLRIDGRDLSVLVTHLSAWGRWRRGVRRAQAACVAAVAARVPRPVILLGDLNAGIGSAELRPLAAAGLRPCGEAGAATHPASAEHLDHVLCAGMRPLAVRAVPAGPSDHRPLVAELGWAAPAPPPAGRAR